MSSPEHQAYLDFLLHSIPILSQDPDLLGELRSYADALVVLWHLDLGPVRPILESCYGPPRGTDPWDPILVLRALLLSALIGEVPINRWAKRLRWSRVLRILCGIDPTLLKKGHKPSPSIGAFYRFLDRLTDGPRTEPSASTPRPSEQLRRRAKAPQPPHKSKAQLKREKAKKGGPGCRKRRQARLADEQQQREQETRMAEALVAALRQNRDNDAPADLTERINRILLEAGVLESARRGLLGDPTKLIGAGDSSPLATAAFGLGKRTCSCDKKTKCDCPRPYADPDARLGYDPYRRRYFFGYSFYEICSPVKHVDLPLYVRLDPANTSEHHRAALAREGLHKLLRDHAVGFGISYYLHDAGHDSRADHEHIRSLGARPIIPLKGQDGTDRILHPKRPDVQLSRRAIPLCQAGVEMASWGTSGPGKSQFVCPVKAGKLSVCPLAPKQDPDWRCEPHSRLGPTIHLNVKDDPRLFPEVARNSTTHKELYKLRSGCERSNSRKKQAHQLEQCRHRRSSYWLIRIGLAALCQHAKAWVRDLDAQAFLDQILGLRQAA